MDLGNTPPRAGTRCGTMAALPLPVYAGGEDTNTRKGSEMECACSLNMDVDDCATVLSDTVVVARKNHQCCECRHVIKPSEIYRREKTLYEGSFETYKTCVNCDSIRREFVSGGWYWGEILEGLRECIFGCKGEISEEKISDLTPGGRATVCEMIEDAWGR